MSYKIAFKKSVLRDLKKLDRKRASEILCNIETELTDNADQYPILKGKFSGLRKFRIGDYRIIYSIIPDETVLILRIAHRKEAYRSDINDSFT